MFENLLMTRKQNIPRTHLLESNLATLVLKVVFQDYLHQSHLALANHRLPGGARGKLQIQLPTQKTSEMWVPSLGQEDPLEKEMATHLGILAWRIPMDRGAWQAIVHGVKKCQTRLKCLNTHTHTHTETHPSLLSERSLELFIRHVSFL